MSTMVEVDVHVNHLIEVKSDSIIWKIFRKHKFQEDHLYCTICKKFYKFCQSTSTHENHFREKHPQEYRAALSEKKKQKQKESQKQPKMGTFFASDTCASTKAIDELVLDYIVEDLRPLSTVDSPAFRKLLNGLKKDYQPPSVERLKKMLENRYLDHVEQVYSYWFSPIAKFKT